MSDLLKAVQEAPEYDGVNWVKYKTAYMALLDKGYTQKAAIDFICAHEGISDADRARFRSSASQWRGMK